MYETLARCDGNKTGAGVSAIAGVVTERSVVGVVSAIAGVVTVSAL